MNKIVVFVLGASLLGGASMAAPASPDKQVEKSSTYYWLHPKLGHVKVDRASNAMVISGKGRLTDGTEQPMRK